MNKKTKSRNTIVARAGALILAIRAASDDELKESVEQFQEFSDLWLKSGDGGNLPGLPDCCLADTDITEAIKSAIEVRIE